MPAKSEKQRRFFYLVKAVQKGKVSPKRVGSKVSKAASSMSAKDVDDFTHGKNLPKKKLEEIVEMLKNLSVSDENPAFQDPVTDLRTGDVNQNTGMSPLEPMALESQMDDPNQTEQNPVAKTFNQTGNFEEYIGKFSGLELKPKEIESVTNYTNAQPTKMDNFLIRYESSDEFNNNTITVIKKLREGTDLVFTVFQSSTQQQGGIEPQGEEKPTGENEIIVTKSRSFTNDIEGGKILADLLQKLDI
jgi:hypothetical protein